MDVLRETLTVDVPAGCWANNATAVAICCPQLGGSTINLTDSSIPGCAYNASNGFTADAPDAATMMNASSTGARWTACVNLHVNKSDVSFTDCEDAKQQEITASGTPSGSAPAPSKSANAGRTVASELGGQFGRVLVLGIAVGGGLLHVLSGAI